MKCPVLLALVQGLDLEPKTGQLIVPPKIIYLDEIILYSKTILPLCPAEKEKVLCVSVLCALSIGKRNKHTDEIDGRVAYIYRG